MFKCDFVDALSGQKLRLVLGGGSALAELGDRYPVTLDGRVLGQYGRITTTKEDVNDAALGTVLSITEGLQKINIEVQVAAGVDTAFMIAIAVALDTKLTDQKQVLQLLGSG